MKWNLFFSVSLSLTLVACQQSAVMTLAPSAAVSHSQTHSARVQSAGQREQLTLNLAFGSGFRTQLAQPSELAYVRVRVEGPSLDGPVYANQGAFMALQSGSVSVPSLELPVVNGELRRVYVEGYDADYQMLGAFRASGWYRSQSGVGTVNLTLNRAQNLLVEVLAELDASVLANLDISALQSLLLRLQGYDAETMSFGRQPETYSASGIAALLGGDTLPELSALEGALAATQAVTVSVLTPNGLALAESVRYVLNDAVSRGQVVASGSASGTQVSLGEVGYGTWTLRAYGGDGRLLGETSVVVSSTGVVLSALLLTGVSEVPPESRVNQATAGPQESPSVAHSDTGEFVVVWESSDSHADDGIYAQRYNSVGQPQGSEFRVNTYTTGLQTAPSVSMDADGDFVVAWQSNGQEASKYGVYAQRYNSLGQAQGSEFRVNTYTTNSQRNPSVSLDADGDFVVAWQSYGQDGSHYGVYAQRYDSMGQVQGSEFRVNTYTADRQMAPSVSLDADGDFVVTWESFYQDGSTTSIYAQRYNSQGQLQGSEFPVNSATTGTQSAPQVSLDADGDFVLAWVSPSPAGIYAQRYNSQGQPQGSEFLANTYTQNFFSAPSVSLDADGDFVVSWQSFIQDGSSGGIYAQRYNSQGQAQGSEFQVNTYTTGNQLAPSVSLDTDGDFVVVWQSAGQDGDSDGVYAQRYSSQGQALGLSPQP
ncbi:MAG: hypothetical protein ACO1RX_19765 [Candidatus Sericytochromatia bacterium]